MRVNLSEWALKHPASIVYFMLVLSVSGIWAYMNLGRAEDPDFTMKIMLVKSVWPGATSKQVAELVTERVEKKLLETPGVDILKSYSKPGESVIFVQLKEYIRGRDVSDAWYQVRKKLNDMSHSFPEGVRGPFVNDEFGDTFGNIIAFTGDGFDINQLRIAADRISKEVWRIPDVKKVELLGVQSERIYVEVSHAKLASLGLDPATIFDVLQRENAMTPSGFINTNSDKFQLRLSNDFETIENIREIGLNIGGRTFRLGDIADIRRGLVEPPEPRFRFNGQDAIGLAISMQQGGDVIKLGENVNNLVNRIKSELPQGLDTNVVSDQPTIVKRSINEFVKSLAEAIVIVLAVSFLSLGLRTGMVVALSIPIVLLVTFTLMKIFDINLQRVSLGALIIALGLLVDDAIIAVEMMVVKLEEGWDRVKAATFAFESTAIPMLTGTLVTVAGFLPIGFARSSSSEYCFSIFAVVTIALLISWIVAVLFTPYIGFKILPASMVKVQHGNVYDTPFYKALKQLVERCLRYRKTVIGFTLVCFVLSMLGFKFLIQSQFFPSADRPELLVDLTLPQGASLKATTEQAEQIEQLLLKETGIDHFVTYVGSGTTRFYLAIDQQFVNDNYAQFVVLTKNIEAREQVRNHLESIAGDLFPQSRVRVQRLENGPPVGFPVQFRISGADFNTIRSIAAQVAFVLRQNPYSKDVQLDWNEMTKQLKLDIDQNKARALGLSSQQIATALNSLLVGSTITQLREGDQLIDVVGRVVEPERTMITTLPDINIHTQSGKYVPLSQVATISFELEEGIIWRRNRVPTITVRTDVKDGLQAVEMTKQVDLQINELRAKLPDGYSIEIGGVIEESGKGERSIMAILPLMAIVTITLLIFQLQSISQTIIVLITAPLGLIGVAIALIVFSAPMGFVANLGVIALSGMIMRNSVILVDQIEQDKRAGKSDWDAIVDSTVRRFRPIMLTALAAILAMIPLTHSIFWGPMAMAIMGGLLVATLLTILFLPALYAAWYKVPVK